MYFLYAINKSRVQCSAATLSIRGSYPFKQCRILQTTLDYRLFPQFSSLLHSRFSTHDGRRPCSAAFSVVLLVVLVVVAARVQLMPSASGNSNSPSSTSTLPLAACLLSAFDVDCDCDGDGSVDSDSDSDSGRGQKVATAELAVDSVLTRDVSALGRSCLP